MEGVTKISRLDLLAPEARQAENVRKMLLAMVNDVRVVVVKLADRLHNMRTLEYLDRGTTAAHRARNARYLCAGREPPGHGLDSRRAGRSCVPLSRAGSFLRTAEESRCQAESFRQVFDWKCRILFASKMVENGIPAEVQARTKRLYSLHQKSSEAAAHSRPDLRFAGRARDHRHGEELLCGAGRDSSDLAAGARALQRLHRHAAAEPVSVAAYHA